MTDHEPVTMAEVELDLGNGAWNVVSWGADRHDSTEYCLHGRFADVDVLVSVLITVDDESIYHTTDVWVYGGDANKHAVLEHGIADDPPGAVQIERLLTRAMSEWSEVVEVDGPPPPHVARKLPVEAADVALIPRSGEARAVVAHFVDMPPVLSTAAHQLVVEGVRQRAQVQLEELGRQLAEDLAPLEERQASVRMVLREVSKEDGVFFKGGLLSYFKASPAKAVAVCTLIAAAVMQFVAGWTTFDALPIAMPYAALAGVASSIAYAGSITLVAAYAGSYLGQRLIRRPNVLMVSTLLLLVVGLVLAVQLATISQSAVSAASVAATVFSIVGVIAAVIAASVLARRQKPTAGLYQDDDRRAEALHDEATIEADRASHLRSYVSRADVVVAAARSEMIGYLRDVAVADEGFKPEPQLLGIDWAPRSEWIDRAREELWRYEKMRDPSGVQMRP